jgi:hypothetical protein
MPIVTNIRVEAEDDFHNLLLELQKYLTKRLGRKISKSAIILEICNITIEDHEDMKKILLERVFNSGSFPLGYYGRSVSHSKKKRLLDDIEADIRRRESIIQEKEASIDAAQKAFHSDFNKINNFQFKEFEWKRKISDLKSQNESLESDLRSEKGKNMQLQDRIERMKMQ